MTLEGTSTTPASDLFDVTGKHVLVTGGGSGIGLMIASGFVAAGAHVTIASRKVEVCKAVAAELSERGPGTCAGVGANLATQEGALGLIEHVAASTDRLDVLVNNAGANWGEQFETFPASGWDRVLDLNVKGVFFVTQAAGDLLKAAGSADSPARVINIGSIDGIQVPILQTYSYSASKAAVHQLTRHLAKELGKHHITVNAVAPGPFESKMMKATLEAAGDAIAATSVLGRIGRPDDMAGVAMFLASRAASYITGAIIPVDGGIATVG